MKTRLSAVLLPFALVTPLTSGESLPPPVLEFAAGLPGKQVRLTWTAAPGLRYRIEKSTDLGASSGGGGGWTQVDLVEATGPEGVWLDPEPPSVRAFYRVVEPQPEVFSLEDPVLSPDGGDLYLRGQGIPANGTLVLLVDGVPREIPLVPAGNGLWVAHVVGSFVPGANVLSSALKDDSGREILTLGIPVAVTATGRAADAPPALPPAAPQSAGKGIPDHGMLVRSMDGGNSYSPWDFDDGDNDAVSNPLYGSGDNSGDNPLFKAARGAVNPLYQGGGTKNNPLYQGHARLQPGLRGNGVSGGLEPSPACLPGEVSFRHVSLDLPCPAGPPLSWVCTYRSKAPVSSGLGPGWDFSYNLSVEPVPAQSGASAPRVVVRDGAGRADTFHRQADGTYRADGLFREGRFDGDTFILTFASAGRWIFRPLDGSPAAGKIAAITDRNGVSLDCAYDSSGRLLSVSDAFGRALAVEWGGSPARVLSVTARSSAGNDEYAKVGYAYTPASSRLQSISAPFVPGQPSVAGAMTFSYAEGQPDPALDGNLLTIHDGASRLLDAFDYAATTDRNHPAFDTWTSHDRHRLQNQGHPVRLSFEPLPGGGYLAFENDEIGRVSAYAYDRMHRLTRSRDYTGFAAPGAAVTGSSLPDPGSRLRAADPAFFETSFTYNADSLCTLVTHPDGSRERVVHDRDFRKDGPVIERANARLLSLISPSGETRTVRCDYLPGFGSPEALRPGNPIRGISVKCGRLSSSHVAERLAIHVTTPKQTQGKTFGECLAGWNDGIDGSMPNRLSMSTTTVRQTQGKTFGEKISSGLMTGMPNRISMNVTTPRQSQGSTFGELRGGLINGMPNRLSMNVTIARQTQGKTFGERVHAAAPLAGGLRTGTDPTPPRQTQGRTFGEPLTGGLLGGLLGGLDASAADAFRKLLDRSQAGESLGWATRLVTAHGQVFAWSYDEHGNCTSASSPLPHRGVLYEYSSLGRCTAVTERDGPGSGFREEFTYDPVTGFITSRVTDPGNLAITTRYERDPLGRVIRLIDPLEQDWLFTWNPLGLCVAASSPAAPQRISMSLVLDASGLVVRRDLDHRAPDGTPDAANPAYSTFFVRDSRTRLIRAAIEERPVDASSATLPDSLGLGNFAAIDFTYDPAGQCVSATTPAACRAQSTDLVTHFAWDERGLLHRCVGGASPGALTLEFDYDLSGAPIRQAIVADGGPSAAWTSSYDGFHRPLSSTDPMGTATVFSYANDGTVTCSVYGEIEDLPGNAENTLLATMRLRKRPEILYQAWDDSIRDDVGGSICPLNLPVCGVDPVAFFGVDVEDDIVTVDRFLPGSSTPVAVETTVWDRSPSGLLQSVHRNDDLLFASSHDSAGRIVSLTDGAVTENFTLNARGEVLVCGRTDHFLVAGPPDKTFVRSYTWDPLGRCTSATDGLGNTSSWTWDSLGRCVELSPPGGPLFRFAYDGTSSSGDFSLQILADPGDTGVPQVYGSCLIRGGEVVRVEEDGAHSTSFLRDSLGRVTRRNLPDGTFETFACDALGRPDTYRRADGVIETTAYNLRGEPVVLAYESSSLPSGMQPLPATTLTYDGLGRLVRCVQGSMQLQWTLDSTGNVISESRDGHSVAAVYDHRGRSRVTYPDGRSFSETRDALGRLRTLSELDASGTPLSPPLAAIEYAGHRPCRSTRANGVTTTWTYRGAKDAPPPSGDHGYDVCTEMVVANALGHELAHVIQQRDRNQRLTRSDTLFSGNPQGPGRSQAFTLDALGRVTACVTHRRERTGAPPVLESAVGYVLGKEGQRVQELRNGIPGTYTQDDTLPPGDRQMNQYTTWPGGPLEWDDAGRLVTLHRGSSSQSFRHDAGGRLVEVLDVGSGSPLARFTYDPLGRLVTLEEGPATTEFVFDGFACVQERLDTGSGNPSITCLVQAGGMLQTVIDASGSRFYPHAQATRHNVQHWGDPHENLKGQHWGDPHENLNGRHLANRDRVWSRPGFIGLLTEASGAVAARADADDAGTPVFLAADGMPVSTGTSIGPVRWMAPEALWVPSVGLLVGSDAAYSPDLGAPVTRVAGHNSSRSHGCGGSTRR